jgi:hypothetical protein
MTNESVERTSAWPNAENWPVQEPSSDFAERTVSALLGSEQKKVARIPRGRWVRLVLLAAFLSASAWGAYEATHTDARGPSAVPASEEPRVVASSLAFAPPVTHAVAERARVKPEAPRTAPTVSKPAAPQPVAAPPPPRVPPPRCQCAPGFVVCGCSD